MSESHVGLASRVREIRVERFGHDGVAAMAGFMEIPERTWKHYEGGVAIPAFILLKFIELTGVAPHWLSTGEGERYLARTMKSDRSASH